MKEQLYYEQGKRIKTIRMEKGMKQEELANKSGLNVTYLSRMEGGYVQISEKSYYALARALNVSVAYLKNEAGENKYDIARDDEYKDINMYNRQQERITREKNPSEILLEKSMKTLLKKIRNDDEFMDVILNIIRELDSYYEIREAALSNEGIENDFCYCNSDDRVLCEEIINRIEKMIMVDIGNVVDKITSKGC